MKGRLIQLLGDGIEELYYTEDKSLTDETFTTYYKEYQAAWDEASDNEWESFEEYMEEVHPDVDVERIFVDEIYI